MSETFYKMSDAKQWAAQVESDIRDKRYFPHRQSEKFTLDDAIALYLREYLPQKSASMLRDQTTQLNWWSSKLGFAKLSDKAVTGPA